MFLVTLTYSDTAFITSYLQYYHVHFGRQIIPLCITIIKHSLPLVVLLYCMRECLRPTQIAIITVTSISFAVLCPIILAISVSKVLWRHTPWKVCDPTPRSWQGKSWFPSLRCRDALCPVSSSRSRPGSSRNVSSSTFVICLIRSGTHISSYQEVTMQPSLTNVAPQDTQTIFGSSSSIHAISSSKSICTCSCPLCRPPLSIWEPLSDKDVV